jgi:Flp pilus assembly protein CpaB
VAIKVHAESVASGLVLPGSRVDVVHTRRDADTTAQVILQDLLVLAVESDKRNPNQPASVAQMVRLVAISRGLLRPG